MTGPNTPDPTIDFLRHDLSEFSRMVDEAKPTPEAFKVLGLRLRKMADDFCGVLGGVAVERAGGPPARAEGVGEVRPLDWQETSNDRGDGFREISGYEADSGFGPWYVISQYFGSDSFGFEIDFDGTKIGDCDSADAAKDVAQDHYAQRIRAAIVSALAPPRYGRLAREAIAILSLPIQPADRETAIRECIVAAGLCAEVSTPGGMRSAILSDLRGLIVQPGAGELEAGAGNSLLLNIRSYARDLARNPSGSDDYPWEFLRAVAKQLDELCDNYLVSLPAGIVTSTDPCPNCGLPPLQWTPHSSREGGR